MKKACELCGKMLPESTSKRGRPRIYHDDCRKLEQLLGWIEDQLQLVDLDPDSAKKVRSRLWYIGNTVRLGGKI
jgi:hypothetical protein